MALMDADAARGHLKAERDRLDGVKAGLQADGVGIETERESLGELSDSPQHQADTGTETFDRERDLSILDQIEAELADVEHALRRLDDGTYGTCEACGKPITEERLDALPAARFCVDDKTQAEREARA
jgi:RNA polymerase-binding transcription factor DksA